MSIVPSEIEYQNDSDAQVETARISGITVFIMLAVLASGFASVGYLAFDELNGDGVVLAQAPPTDDGAPDADVPNDSPPAQTESDSAAASDEDTLAPSVAGNETPSTTDDAILDDGAEFVVAQLPPPTGAPVETEPPLAKGPSPTPPPTVMYDPAVFDDLPDENGAADIPAEEAEPSPAETPSAEPHAVETNNADEAPAPSIESPAREETSLPVDVVDAPEEETPPAVPDDAQTTVAPVETTSPPADNPVPPVAETAPAPAPATIDAMAGTHVVQLASYRSEAEATADWGRIETRLGAYLTGKTYQIERADLGERGIFFRLRIGPFSSSDEAQSYCAGLKERGQDCLALRR